MSIENLGAPPEKTSCPTPLSGGDALALRTILILYVEDDLGISEQMQPVLGDGAVGAIATWRSQGRTWSSQSRHVRSMKGAMNLLEKEGFQPDLVLHDGQIPYTDGVGKAADPKAGDALYRLLCGKRLPSGENLPILVISSDTHDGTIDREPYRSNPPLAFLEKKATVAEIRAVIEKFYLKKLEQ